MIRDYLKWRNLPILLLLVFGEFYSFFSDLSFFIGPDMSDELRIVVRVAFCLAIIVIALVYIWITSRLRTLIAKFFGFSEVWRHWFPLSSEKRISCARQVIHHFVSEGRWPLRIATVSGEWDLVRPFSDTEFLELFSSQKCKALILLSHPDSEGLKRHCEKEPGQELRVMKQKIVRNTKKLLEFGGNQCEVRWYFPQPIFHVIADQIELHFGYYPRGQRGHVSHRYIVKEDDELFHTLGSWFEILWSSSVDARQELPWVEESILSARAVFLDRDGTIIEDLGYSGSSNSVEIKILPGVIQGLKELRENGYRLIVISNQQAVGLGLVTQDELARLTKRIKDLFAAHDVYLDAFYYCTHREHEQCNCRKPKPLLFQRAAKQFDLDLSKCHMIGDSDSDIEVKRYLPALAVHKIDNRRGFLQVVREEILRSQKAIGG